MNGAAKTRDCRRPQRRLPKPQAEACNGTTSPNSIKEQELKAYREMLMIRRFEEKAGQLYGMGFIGGFCHLYIGQEAVVVGMQMALKEGDQVITGYRDHGHMLACGMSARGVMAELTGRRGGFSKGKGGSMHMFSKEKNFYGGHGIVGAQVSLGTGLAFANQLSRQRQCRRSPISAMALPTRARSTRASTWLSCGSCRSSTSIENNRYAMGTSAAALLGADRFLPARLILRHSRHPGRWHGCARRQGRRRRGDSNIAAPARVRSFWKC